jgi:hypothetical protein
MRRLVLLMTIGALCSLGLATPVLAASPGNDSYAGRGVIDGLPFSDAIDTTEATTDALDAEANVECGAPLTDASVWYELTPDAEGHVLVDASGSDYAAGVLILGGSPGSFSALACGPGAASVSLTPGETLTILIFDYDGEGNGGNLALSIDAAPPPPTLDLAVAASGSFVPRTGTAIIRGTITCLGGGPDGKFFLDVSLTQSVGRLKIVGYGATGFACDGTAEPWEVEVVGENGLLGGGKATVTVFAFACAFECSEVVVDRVVTLKR